MGLINLATLIVVSSIAVAVALLTWRIFRMPTQQEVHDLVAAGVDAVKTHLDATAKRVTASLDALTASVADLKSQLAAAGTPADFSDVESKLAELQTEADAIAPAP